jgi:hypothetical protein
MSSIHRTLQDQLRAPFEVRDPGSGTTINVDRHQMVVPLVSAAAETRILAQPTKAGLLATINLATDGGNVTLTITGGYDLAGNTKLIFDDAGDFVMLYSVKIGSSYKWRILSSRGVYGGGLWPSPADNRYNSMVHEYFNDFRASAADYDATNEWTLTEDDAACAQALSADAVCGELLLTNKATTDDNAQQINLNQESFKLATGKNLWFEARFKTAAGATQIDWAVGLVEAEDLTGVANNMPANGVVFKKDDGDTNIDLSSSDNGTDTESAAIGTWDTSYHRLGFYFDGGATGVGTITPYVDGVAGTPITVTFATMAELAPIFMVRNGDATTTQTMTIDYIRVVQLR